MMMMALLKTRHNHRHKCLSVFLVLCQWMIHASFAILAEDSTTLLDPEDYEDEFYGSYEGPTRQNDKFSNPAYPYLHGGGLNALHSGFLNNIGATNYRCSIKLEDALEQIRRRRIAKEKSIPLEGYSLHQHLRTAPFDMYVTDMRVRLPSSSSWVRVDRCVYDPRNTSLETRLLFNDLTISGRVNLLKENDLLGRERDRDREQQQERHRGDSCNMILRLRRAGIGFHTEPIRRDRGQFNIRTDSHFMEPGFISVYAYGCESRLREHRRDLPEEDDEIGREMEDIFLRGIRSLLTTYMQKELQPAIKETLMTNMGYTVSYG